MIKMCNNDPSKAEVDMEKFNKSPKESETKANGNPERDFVEMVLEFLHVQLPTDSKDQALDVLAEIYRAREIPRGCVERSPLDPRNFLGLGDDDINDVTAMGQQLKWKVEDSPRITDVADVSINDAIAEEDRLAIMHALDIANGHVMQYLKVYRDKRTTHEDILDMYGMLDIYYMCKDNKRFFDDLHQLTTKDEDTQRKRLSLMADIMEL
jgi:hypothetical protein